MKKILPLILICITIAILSGCESFTVNRHEIEDVIFIRVTGVDKALNDRVRMTMPLYGLKAGASGGAGGVSPGKGEKLDILSDEGSTLFEVTRKIHSYLMKDLTFTHLKFLIIGEEAAKDDIVKYIDYFTRDHEPRLGIRVMIAKNSDAEDVVKKINTPEVIVIQKLTAISQGVGALSISSELQLHELLEMLDPEYSSAYIPCVELVKTIERPDDEEGMDIALSGYAIIKDKKLLGYITDEAALGLNFIRDKVVSGVIVIKDNEGNEISVEIAKSKTEIIPKIRNNRIEVDIKVLEESNIAEYEGKENIFNQEELESIEKKQSDIIKEDIEKVIKYAQENKADFLGIGDKVYHAYPIEWDERYKDDWQNIFSKIKMNVQVNTKVSRAYKIVEPTK